MTSSDHQDTTFLVVVGGEPGNFVPVGVHQSNKAFDRGPHIFLLIGRIFSSRLVLVLVVQHFRYFFAECHPGAFEVPLQNIG